jgi:hypothetical protein
MSNPAVSPALMVSALLSMTRVRVGVWIGQKILAANESEPTFMRRPAA